MSFIVRIGVRIYFIHNIDGVFEKRHDSQDAAEKYLRDNGKPKANRSAIREALKSKKELVRYGRTWKRVD